MRRVRRDLHITNGEMPRKRTKAEIAADRKKRMAKDALASKMIRNFKYEAAEIKNRMSQDKKKLKDGEGAKKRKEIVFEDMIPQHSLHKLTV